MEKPTRLSDRLGVCNQFVFNKMLKEEKMDFVAHGPFHEGAEIDENITCLGRASLNAMLHNLKINSLHRPHNQVLHSGARSCCAETVQELLGAHSLLTMCCATDCDVQVLSMRWAISQTALRSGGFHDPAQMLPHQHGNFLVSNPNLYSASGQARDWQLELWRMDELALRRHTVPEDALLTAIAGDAAFLKLLVDSLGHVWFMLDRGGLTVFFFFVNPTN
jgi:hypothetical protein